MGMAAAGAGTILNAGSVEVVGSDAGDGTTAD